MSRERSGDSGYDSGASRENNPSISPSILDNQGNFQVDIDDIFNDKPTMEVKQLMIFPIKGIRGVILQSARVTPMGFENDRRFAICKKLSEFEYKPLGAGYLDLARFEVFIYPDSSGMRVSYQLSSKQRRERGEGKFAEWMFPYIPCQPCSTVDGLTEICVPMGNTNTHCFAMGQVYNDFFTSCLGFDCVLVYLGNTRRLVHGPVSKWVAQMYMNIQDNHLVEESERFARLGKKTSLHAVAFADSASLMIVNYASVQACNKILREAVTQSRIPVVLPDKFRPNIVVNELQVRQPWSEDNWVDLETVPERMFGEKRRRPIKIKLGGNCIRTRAINVDNATGKESKYPEGRLFDLQQPQRNIDPDNLNRPVFGRFGYPILEGLTSHTDVIGVIRVGDRIRVKQQVRPSEMRWGLATPPIENDMAAEGLGILGAALNINEDEGKNTKAEEGKENQVQAGGDKKNSIEDKNGAQDHTMLLKQIAADMSTDLPTVSKMTRRAIRQSKECDDVNFHTKQKSLSSKVNKIGEKFIVRNDENRNGSQMPYAILKPARSSWDSDDDWNSEDDMPFDKELPWDAFRRCKV